MCGITGIFAFNLVGKFNKIHITAATMSLERRGPDVQDIHIDEWTGIGHRRLCVIDTSSAANQPLWDSTGRYCIAFNGEIFNYRELQKELLSKGVEFQSSSDTEVLLELFVREKKKCLDKLNGFFAFCVYDKDEQTFFLARDRYGVKPLLYLFDEDKFIFASEMKAMLQYGIDRTIDYASLSQYLQLNYIPAPATIFREVKKLLPGHWLKVSRGKLASGQWYSLRNIDNGTANAFSFDEAKQKFRTLLEQAVERRLVSDVPLGAFLSGGIDSSILTGLAVRQKSDLRTFSIGFRDEPFFDETKYAELAAKHFGTSHTVFRLTNDDLFRHVNAILDYIDEPFADSSAINVFILSRETKRHATVALSGDGADELLGGYNKHEAFYRTIHPGLLENLIRSFGFFWETLPSSRNNAMANRIRQARRFANGSALPAAERYWQWAAFATREEAIRLLAPHISATAEEEEKRKQSLLHHLTTGHSMNDILLTDMELVLANDMLVKVDLMSMANGLEVRSPFLDPDLVNFCFTLPADFKIRGSARKIILRETFKDLLPPALYSRPKKGFEVPLLKWFRKEMKSLILDDLLSRKTIEEQNVFNYEEIEKLTKQLFSNNPGDVHARIWALIVFQWWFRRYARS